MAKLKLFWISCTILSKNEALTRSRWRPNRPSSKNIKKSTILFNI